MIILSCSNVALAYGTNKILENISFNIQENEKVGVVGVNGAGKSTLVKILCGALSPDSGEIFIGRGLKLGIWNRTPVLIPKAQYGMNLYLPIHL
jgi:ATP-binding cassette subfamily F protein 3